MQDGVMEEERFEQEFPDFHLEFYYHATGNIKINPLEYLQGKHGENLMEGAENLAAFMREHATQWSFFIKLYWRTLEVITIQCDESTYQGRIVTQEVVDAARNYKPPVL